MSYRKISGAVAAIIAALVLTGGAYGDPGKNGPPGPEGNPNQPAAQPQANGPQGPAGNNQQGQSGSSQGQSDSGKSGQSHGKSDQSHGKSGASHGNSGATTHGNSGQSHGNSGSHANHANPSPGTPRKGGREDRPAGKITICHATKSVKNPYVEITISVNGLHGHGPADAPHHHAGSWKDIIPAPAEGCPGTVQQQNGSTEKEHENGSSEKEQEHSETTQPAAAAAPFIAVVPEVAVSAP